MSSQAPPHGGAFWFFGGWLGGGARLGYRGGFGYEGRGCAGHCGWWWARDRHAQSLAALRASYHRHWGMQSRRRWHHRDSRYAQHRPRCAAPFTACCCKPTFLGPAQGILFILASRLNVRRQPTHGLPRVRWCILDVDGVVEVQQFRLEMLPQHIGGDRWPARVLDSPGYRCKQC